jgi:hypothetical protein
LGEYQDNRDLILLSRNLEKSGVKWDSIEIETFIRGIEVGVAGYFDGKKFAADVQKDMEYGEKIGVKSTPTFFVNGQLVAGAVPIEQFAEIIDESLEK